jgi:hypothetical protein
MPKQNKSSEHIFFIKAMGLLNNNCFKYNPVLVVLQVRVVKIIKAAQGQPLLI